MAKMVQNGKHNHLFSFRKWRKSHSFLDWMVTSISSFWGINSGSQVFWLLWKVWSYLSQDCDASLHHAITCLSGGLLMCPHAAFHTCEGFSISIPRATAWQSQGICQTDVKEVTWAISSSPCHKKCLNREIIIFCRWTGLFDVQLQVQVVSKLLVITILLPTW